MRITPLFVATLLLLLALSQTGNDIQADPVDEVQVLVWDQVAGRGALQQGNNTTPPTFAELVPIIIFVLAGVGIAIVVVAVALWIAKRARKGKGGEGEEQAAPEGTGEAEEWGAKWEP